MPLAAGPTGPLPPTPRPPRVARPAEGGWGRRLARRHRRLTVLGVLVVALLAVAATAVAAGMWRERDAEPAALCTSATTVRVVVDPSLVETVERVAAEADGRVLSTGVCADVEVVAQAPVETAAELASDVSTTPPDIWVPDSSVWLGRAVGDPEREDVSLTVLGSLVSTPLVVATSPEVVTEEGWSSEGPTWAGALTSGREIALPDLAGSSVGVQSLVALRATVDDPEQARGALTSAAVAIDRGRVADLEAALAQVSAAGADAPVVPTTEQQVFVANRGSTQTGVVAVHPTDGSTSLDYPVVRVDTAERAAGVDAAAVEGVVRLLETEGREAALGDGFRAPLDQGTDVPSVDASPAEPSTGASGQPSAETSPEPTAEPSDAAGSDGLPLVIPPPSSSDVDSLLAQLEEISRPSRVLAVFDASASMRGVTQSGPTRAQVAQDAAKSSLAMFPDTADIGLWFFAVGMGSGGADHVEVVPIRSLDPEADVDQRAELAAGVDTLPSRLTPGGTGLYDTTLAAVRHLRENHDPEASNSVVLVTDGRDEDPSGISQAELVETLRAEADPDRPVRVIVIGLSADVDAAELRAIAEASGGTAYLAERPEDFQAVLFDALRRR